MKKALAIFLCILLLTGCAKAPVASEETQSDENQVLVLCADDSNLTIPLGARTVLQTAAPAAPLITPAVSIPDNIFILSSGVTLNINNMESFSEEEIRTAADAIPTDAFDNYRLSGIIFNEDNASRLMELLTAQYGARPSALQSAKQLLFQAQMIPGLSARIDHLCAPGQDTTVLDTDLTGQLTNYFRLKLRDYNDSYEKLGCNLGSSDRVKTEWPLWQEAFSAQEASLKANYTHVESNIAIRSVTEQEDFLIIGLQEQLYIDYTYADGAYSDRMAYSINHALVLQVSDKGYQVVRDFYSCPILGLDTTEGIDRFVPAEAETLVWLMSCDEESGQWRPAGYVWER